MKRTLLFLSVICLTASLMITGCDVKARTPENNSSKNSVSLLPEGNWQELPDFSSDPASSAPTGSGSYVTSSGSIVSSGTGSDALSQITSALTSSNKQSNTSNSTNSNNSFSTSTSGSKSTTPTTAPIPGTLLLKYTPKYSKGFHIEFYVGGAKIIATHIEKTANTAAFSQRVLILPQGAAEPKGVAWDKKIQGNIERAVTMSSSHAGHFANLNAVNVVKGTSINTDSCYIPSLKTALQNGGTVYVGAGSLTDKELVASLEPQVVFVGGMQSDTDLASKLEESGIFCFYFGDFAEDDFMGRAQWIELIGAFIGKEKQAQDFIKSSESKVNTILLRASQIQEKPDVLWFTHSSQAPHWNLRTSYDYVNSMVSSLGGKLIFPPGTTENTIKLSNESFLEYMTGADRIIYAISLNSYKEAKDITYFNKEGQVDFSTSPAFINNHCYVVGYDWAQDTADVAGIVGSLAICLYPDDFKDLQNSGKIMKFKVD